MTWDQTSIFAILALAMAFFIWGRFRYDLVAFGALILATLVQIVPFDQAFLGFGSPAVVTVALVLVISKAIENSGVLTRLSEILVPFADRPIIFMSVLMLFGALLSGFMNNVGALALLLPLALQAKAPPALILMPLSFGTILGGLTTLIGTPPNIIVSQYRQSAFGESFALFDFAPVGAVAAVVGCLFIVLLGWRFIPKRQSQNQDNKKRFSLEAYVTEVCVKPESPAVGRTLYKLENEIEGEVQIVGLIRAEARMLGNLRLTRLQDHDLLLVRAHPDALNELLQTKGLELVPEEERDDSLEDENVVTAEAIVAPGSLVEGRTAKGVFLRARYALNLLAIAREGQAFVPRLQNTVLAAGDVLLIQGDRQVMPGSMQRLGLLPLMQRDIKLGQQFSWIPLLLFACGIGLTSLNLMPIYAAFSLVVVGLVLLRQIEASKLYRAIDWPILVLLACMIPLGNALQSTGATLLVANYLTGLSNFMPPLILLALILVVTMSLSDVMNNAATAVVMAPISATVALQLGYSPDPFLMAVAVGASCAFLTPIGHQNNLLVMGAGGYKFGDYWRMGLPLEVLLVLVTVPLIAWVWPL